MLDWILRHTGGILDWFLVCIFVYMLVFLVQWMINFLQDVDESNK